MAFRLEIASKIKDSRSLSLKQKIQTVYDTATVDELEVVDVYTIDKQFVNGQREKIISSLLNPLIQIPISGELTEKDFDFALEIGFLPGVTDNIAHTTKEIIEDLLHSKFSNDENVYTSQLILIKTKKSKAVIEKIALTLANPLIQRIHIKDKSQFIKDNGMDLIVPKVKLNREGDVIEVDLNISDEQLTKIGKQGILNPDGSPRGPLALDLDAMKAIQKYFRKLKRNPTDIELESLAQTWSEHCKHTIFASPMDDDVPEGLYKTFIKKATEIIRRQKGKDDFCVSVFTDNSGAIAFDDEYLITHKVETHNTPSALDPFGGSITGIVGVNRDTLGFGLGAKPIANTYGFCFAPPDDTQLLYKDAKLTQVMLPPKRIIEGVISGVNAGGNQSGIPTPQGFLYFNSRYKGKPLVFVGTVGLMKKESDGRKLYQKQSKPGDLIVMIGGKVGLDGIHGATFSSEALDSGSPSTAVQIGDPITQKKFSDAISKEAIFEDLYSSITDNGAGGLSCSVAEMAKESGGCRVDLEKVPLKYPGLDPWQIWISESQERMTLSVPKNKWEKLSKLLEDRGVDSSVIGEFTKSGKCEVYYKDKIVMDIDLEFLHNGIPLKKLQTNWQPTVYKEPSREIYEDYSSTLLEIIKRLNISGYDFISTQYDHEVQSLSVLKPLQGRGRINSETSVIRPLRDSKRGVALSQGVYPSYSEINPYQMALCSIDTSIRNLVSVGVDPEKIAILDNFCWCSSSEPERLGQLKLAAKGCFDGAVGFLSPFISGKDSMFNDFKGFDESGKPVKISIPPTLLISSLGLVSDITKVVSIEPKFEGDLIYVLGETKNELGGSEYFAYWSEKNSSTDFGNNVPTVNIEENKRLYKALHQSIEQGLVVSSISVTRGGLAAAFSKMVLSSKLGLNIAFDKLTEIEDEAILFSESQGRAVVSINPKFKDQFEDLFAGLAFYQVGQVTDKQRLLIKGISGSTIVDLYGESLERDYNSNFSSYTQKKKPNVLVVTGYGINCEEETKFAFDQAGGEAEIVHINDLITNKKLINKFQIMAIPGGFSYGDDTGSGNAFANKMKNHLWESLQHFISLDRLIIGICNGCQILANLGLFPAIDKKYGEKQIAILHNDNALYTDRWVDLKTEGKSYWVKDINTLSCPIAHGEGKIYASDDMLEQINQRGLVALRYTKGEVCNYLDLAANPNGAIEDIAGITDETGRILGLMPHPERAMFSVQRPDWPFLKEKFAREGKQLPDEGPGLQIFRNGVNYFK